MADVVPLVDLTPRDTWQALQGESSSLAQADVWERLGNPKDHHAECPLPDPTAANLMVEEYGFVVHRRDVRDGSASIDFMVMQKQLLARRFNAINSSPISDDLGYYNVVAIQEMWDGDVSPCRFHLIFEGGPEGWTYNGYAVANDDMSTELGYQIIITPAASWLVLSSSSSGTGIFSAESQWFNLRFPVASALDYPTTGGMMASPSVPSVSFELLDQRLTAEDGVPRLELDYEITLSTISGEPVAETDCQAVFIWDEEAAALDRDAEASTLTEKIWLNVSSFGTSEEYLEFALDELNALVENDDPQVFELLEALPGRSATTATTEPTVDPSMTYHGRPIASWPA